MSALAVAGRTVGDRRRTGQLVLCLSAVLMLAAGLAALAGGAAGYGPGAVLKALVAGMSGNRSGLDAGLAAVVLDIRLPRVLLAMAVGAALALSGAMLQGLFRNPLADPGLVGVSSGAALAAICVIVLGGLAVPLVPAALVPHLLPMAAFAGGMVSTFLVYRMSTFGGHTSMATMLLSGIALAAIAGAFTGILTFISTDQQLRELTFWTMGGLGGATWTKLLAALPLMIPAFLAAPLLGGALDRLAMGEAEAFHLGVSVEPIKRLAVLVIAAAVGAAVSVSGIVGFVGLVAPHLVRLVAGPGHRVLLPAAACTGAALLALADLVARTLVAPAELPLGIVTALIGAPFFLFLLMRSARAGKLT
ncbi:FecCD family ABC transporter permease [Aureimonas frigidaquae]|uniref:HmuU protein n=1 Tax=Aureimonas frigidaquae TaxID=424757 RepID=A0A0P0Z134_9HYPH|nr:iron ABC transporter permease [Aureimonas frigidaquae]BAT27640.1 HmuU protein [Aureimonas frigidaquae]